MGCSSTAERIVKLFNIKLTLELDVLPNLGQFVWRRLPSEFGSVG